MNLVLLTSHYPYGNQETFLEQEIRILKDLFDEIIIVTFARERNITKYIPKNCKVILLREKRFSLKILLSAIISMMHPRVFEEWKFAKNKLNIKKNKLIFQQIFLYQYFYFIIFSKLNKYLDKNDTIFYSYWLSPGAYALAKMKKKGNKIFAISRAHGGDAFIDRGYKPFRREILTHLDEIHFISSAGMKSVQKNIFPYMIHINAKIFVSRLGIIKKYHGMNPTLKSKEVFHLVSCSNIIYLKRLDLIVTSLAQIKGIKVLWTHFGDGELRNDIEIMANKAFTGTEVSLELLGHVGNDEILQYYLENPINVFVNVSDCEGIPVSIMEAMSYGIPAIARDVGGNNEIVKNDVNGILLNSDIDPSDLAGAIMEVVIMPMEKYNSLCLEAFNTFKNDYNAKVNYKSFGDHLKEKYYDKYL